MSSQKNVSNSNYFVGEAKLANFVIFHHGVRFEMLQCSLCNLSELYVYKYQ